VTAAMTANTPSASASIGDEIVPGSEVVRLLRRGSRLDTYDVYNHERDCRCVLKVLREDREDEPRCREALLREGTLLRDLTHPHLVRAYQVFERPRTAILLETLTGDTLAALIEDAPLSPADTAMLGAQLASALGYLHRQGWLHLDVKPSNVVVQGGRAILLDLSVANRPGDGRPHAGTYGYLAPEQATGRGLSPACDVFGLAVTMGEALTGLLAFGEPGWWRVSSADRTPTRPFRRRLAKVPEPLAGLILTSLDADPAQRPPMSDVLRTLSRIASDGSR
jgi:serine/threonine protein kinase